MKVTQIPNKYCLSDTSCVIERNRFIREVKILKVTDGFDTLRFTDRDAGIKLRESRLFPTREDAIGIYGGKHNERF